MARMTRIEHQLTLERDGYRADFEAALEKLVPLQSANETLSREVMSLRGELAEERRKTERAVADRNEVSWLLVLQHWKGGR